MNSIIKDKNNKIKYWQNKYYRLRKKINKGQDNIIDNVKEIERKRKEAVKQRLINCEVLQKQLIDRRKELEGEQKKSFFVRIVTGKIIKKI